MTLSSGCRVGSYERGSTAFFLERVSLSSFPFIIDDPPKGTKGGVDINDVTVELYSGTKTANMRRIRTPHSTALIATNFPLSTDKR